MKKFRLIILLMLFINYFLVFFFNIYTFDKREDKKYVVELKHGLYHPAKYFPFLGLLTIFPRVSYLQVFDKENMNYYYVGFDELYDVDLDSMNISGMVYEDNKLGKREMINYR